MPLVMPPVTKVLGKKLVIFLNTPPASADGIPTLTEVNEALFAACHIYQDFNVTPEQNSGSGTRKMCSMNEPTQLGLTSYPQTDVQYSYMPQLLGTPGGEGNEVYEALEPGSQVTAVVVTGVDAKTDTLPADTVADIYLMDVGKRRKGATTDDEFGDASITQGLVVAGGEPIAEDHVLADTP